MTPGLHHLALGAHDVERVAGFYRDVLGLPEVKRHFTDSNQLRSVWLDLGGALLMVEATSDEPRSVVGVGAGPFLIAIRIPSEERASWEARLEAQGAPIEARTSYTSYARDPEGNRVAISHYAE